MISHVITCYYNGSHVIIFFPGGANLSSIKGSQQMLDANLNKQRTTVLLHN